MKYIPLDPKCCSECLLFEIELGHYCRKTLKDYWGGGIPDWCPLKDLPERKKIRSDMPEWQKHYCQGINDTISMIEGTMMQTWSDC